MFEYPVIDERWSWEVENVKFTEDIELWITLWNCNSLPVGRRRPFRNNRLSLKPLCSWVASTDAQHELVCAMVASRRSNFQDNQPGKFEVVDPVWGRRMDVIMRNVEMVEVWELCHGDGSFGKQLSSYGSEKRVSENCRADFFEAATHGWMWEDELEGEVFLPGVDKWLVFWLSCHKFNMPDVEIS